MTIFNPPIMTLTANAATPVDFIQLGNKEYRIDIEFPPGALGTITPKQTVNPANTNALHDCKESGTAISVTGSYSFIIAGPCFVGFVVSGLSGTVKVTANATD